MANFTAEEEVFEMACQMERNGRRYYEKAAAGADDEATRKLLEELASREMRHEKTFAEMRRSIPESQATEMFDKDEEAALYLRAMVAGRVFDPDADPSQRLTGQETRDEVLATALGMEKDSIIFYLGIRDMVAEGKGRDQIDRIIREEMSHVRILSEQRHPPH